MLKSSLDQEIVSLFRCEDKTKTEDATAISQEGTILHDLLPDWEAKDTQSNSSSP
jgi:hypothetical protein